MSWNGLVSTCIVASSEDVAWQDEACCLEQYVLKELNLFFFFSIGDSLYFYNAYNQIPSPRLSLSIHCIYPSLPILWLIWEWVCEYIDKTQLNSRQIVESTNTKASHTNHKNTKTNFHTSRLQKVTDENRICNSYFLGPGTLV